MSSPITGFTKRNRLLTTSSEEVRLQAERDLTALIKNNETRGVQNDRTTTIANHDARTVKTGKRAGITMIN